MTTGNRELRRKLEKMQAVRLNGYPSMRSGRRKEQGGFFGARPLLLRLTLAILFAASLGIRIYRIGDPPLDFHPVRQYFHALRVRSYYYTHLDRPAPEWIREVAESQTPTPDVMEPPIMESMTLLLWWLAGGVHLWIPRLLSSLFWIAGGVMLYQLAKKTACADGAVVAIAFYLLVPYGVLASRTFMRDPLLVMMLLCSILTIVRYHQQPSARSVVIAGGASAVAVFIKPISLFMILAAFLSLAVHRQGLRESLLDPHLWAFGAVAIPMAGAFHGYPLLSWGQREAASLFFKPHYLLDPFFYRNWLAHIQSLVGLGPLTLGVVGVLLFRQGMERTLAVGLWCGYLVFGLVFTHHARTHSYYHLQLVPLVALCLGPVGALILARLGQLATRWHLEAAVVGTILLGVILGLGVTAMDLSRQDFEEEVRAYGEVGDIVDHSVKTVCLDEHYGFPLQYYGWLSCEFWPSDADLVAWGRLELLNLSPKERFLADYASAWPEYFLITNFQEFERQVDLRRFLVENFPVSAQTKHYLVFDLRKADHAGTLNFCSERPLHNV